MNFKLKPIGTAIRSIYPTSLTSTSLLVTLTDLLLLHSYTFGDTLGIDSTFFLFS